MVLDRCRFSRSTPIEIELRLEAEAEVEPRDAILGVPCSWMDWSVSLVQPSKSSDRNGSLHREQIKLEASYGISGKQHE